MLNARGRVPAWVCVSMMRPHRMRKTALVRNFYRSVTLNGNGKDGAWALRNDRAIAETVRHAQIPLCITDPTLPDNPIVFANAAFCDLTGYAEDEVIGQNCRMLQGPGTTEESVAAIRKVIASAEVDTVEILNYRKDGTSFVNALQIGPILDDDGALMYYFGSQLDVTAKREMEKQARQLADDELLHRLRNIVNVMNVIVRMTGREENDTAALATKIGERLTALSDVHFNTIRPNTDEGTEFEALARTILAPYAPGGLVQLNLSGPAVALPAGLISPITLGLHELATNSVKHGALSVAEGRVELRWVVQDREEGRSIAFHWEETNGPPVVVPARQSGSRIIKTLTTSTGGDMAFDWRESGLIVKADFPL
jgi:PAS domain S-box-containing protein